MSIISQIIAGFRNPQTRFLFVLFGLADLIIAVMIAGLILTHNYAGAISAAVTYVVIYFCIRYLIKIGLLSFQPTNYERRGVTIDPEDGEEIS